MMQHPFFWPTKTLILDDNERYLDEMKQLLSNDAEFIFCSDSKEAQQLINNQGYNFNWFSKSLNYRGYGQESYDIDYKSIHSAIYDNKRRDIISTILIDYHMPLISGIDFCNSISPELGVRKILLTANMGYQNAVENLNNNAIHGFLSKQDITLGTIMATLKRENSIFFKNHSIFLNKCIKLSNNNHPIFYQDYTNHFNNLIEQYKIKEYYLLNELGWYLLVDNNNRKYYLFIFSEEEMQEMIEEARLRGIEPSLYNSLKTYSKALCYYNSTNSGWPLLCAKHTSPLKMNLRQAY